MGWISIFRQTSFLILAIITPGILSIRISEMRVPKFLLVGAEGELDCSWEGESDKMYSIKWYQGSNEFYRYTPTAKDPIQIFDLPTLDIDRERSWGGSVRIANVTLGAAGPFYCEVSADGPSFHTMSNQTIIHVIDFPDGGPIIKGVQHQYLVGDWIDITCMSLRAKPAPYLSFSINNQANLGGWVEPQENNMDHEGLYTSSIRMRFALTQRVLIGGQAKVQCKAHIPNYYEKTANEVIRTMPRTESLLDGGLSAGDHPKSSSTPLKILTAAAFIALQQWLAQ